MSEETAGARNVQPTTCCGSRPPTRIGLSALVKPGCAWPASPSSSPGIPKQPATVCWFARHNTFSRAGDLRESLLHVDAHSGT